MDLDALRLHPRRDGARLLSSYEYNPNIITRCEIAPTGDGGKEAVCGSEETEAGEL